MSHTSQSNPQDLGILVLAAGKGTRMHSELAKVLHPIAGIPMVAHALHTTQSFRPERSIVVVGHQAQEVKDALDQEFGKGTLQYALQEQQLGTAHAVMAAKDALQDGPTSLFLLAGDVPLLTEATLQRMLDAKTTQEAAVVLLSFVAEDPTGYGRILRDENGQVQAIREHRDCTEEQRLVKESNAAIYLVDTAFLLDSLSRIDDQNDQGEFYLTDIVEIAVAAGKPVIGQIVEDATEVMGVNDRAQLAHLEQVWMTRRIQTLMRSGVTFKLPHTTAIDFHVQIDPEVTIEPHCYLKGRTHIQRGAQIGAYSLLQDQKVAAHTLLAPRSNLHP